MIKLTIMSSGTDKHLIFYLPKIALHYM